MTILIKLLIVLYIYSQVCTCKILALEAVLVELLAIWNFNKLDIYMLSNFCRSSPLTAVRGFLAKVNLTIRNSSVAYWLHTASRHRIQGLPDWNSSGSSKFFRYFHNNAIQMPPYLHWGYVSKYTIGVDRKTPGERRKLRLFFKFNYLSVEI